ncbi:ABC transporter ATP-binding protein [Oceanirhabdus sp. W0125-5]|uniref:ABC transporter ATP-binding protein n=1 Tax=Oceanirhabdus sp. W0125-5 TaxID=2999116 RepID=UPI0022F2BB31|nr:ATP-binding cassette domain-containing protein [Oceanirhabdus sp. W0125-5]WBW98400.1 ATP-binding cassette domain-containing protein [Oceanirhabdus sp. W0125-5]
MIEVKNLTRDFKIYNKGTGLKGTFKSLFKNDFEIKRAVDNMNFKINKGEIVGYIGANGAGKSTTIKMMSGILVPTSGECIVNGMIPYENRTKNAKNIGVVFGQKTQLWWDLPLGETFNILKDIYEVEDKAFKERLYFLDDVLEISKFKNNAVRTLSLGQRMRADLAASLIHNPQILYLDEPTIGLDVMVKERIRQAIKEINREYKTTIILTTHDMSDIEELSHRIIMIDEGKKIYDGELNELKKEFGVEKTLKIELKNSNKVKNMNIPKLLNLGEEDIKSDIDGNYLNITFDRRKTEMSHIISSIVKGIEIKDLIIEDMNVEDIVKGIYRKNN